MERKVTYFESPGPQHTEDCLEITRKLLDEGYKHLVVASTSGKTGLLFVQGLEDFAVNLIVVAHSAGFGGAKVIELEPENAKKIIQLGAKLHQGTMPFHSLENSLEKEHAGTLPASLVAHALRLFGQGVKVTCEIVMMAADTGSIPEGAEVVAVAGTRSGADTVAILKAAPSRRFLDLKVLEIAAKPREW